MEFRRAIFFDIAVLAEMESKYVECGYSVNVLEQTIADEHSQIILLTDSNKIVGYGGYKQILDTAEIFNIVVDMPYRRKGYGAQILQHICAQAKIQGAKEIFLEVNEHNSVAINLYIRSSFEQISIRKNYYKSGNALIMKKTL